MNGPFRFFCENKLSRKKKKLPRRCPENLKKVPKGSVIDFIGKCVKTENLRGLYGLMSVEVYSIIIEANISSDCQEVLGSVGDCGGGPLKSDTFTA